MTNRGSDQLPLPPELQARVSAFEEDCPELLTSLTNQGENAGLLRQQLQSVVACSEFSANLMRRQPELISSLIEQGDLLSLRSPEKWRSIESNLSAEVAVADFSQAQQRLRYRRQREMLRIAWRDLAGLSELEESLADLSALADCCIRVAVSRSLDEIAIRHGRPCDKAGNQSDLVVIAMGKLGGGELNFSSDIDLIFLHQSAGESDGDKPLDNGEYFARVIRKCIALLSDRTPDGFVFRVDTRLRPFGDSGPMSMNFSQAEQYYLTHGREWERYAWIKARAVVGTPEAVAELNDFMRPFVYRRYLDFGVFAAIRDMKAMIEQEIRQSGEEHNIKLGLGGIREIEFMVQAMQLVRAGQETVLQERRLLPALVALEKGGHIDSAVAEQLRADYCWLRHCENRLQAWADEQTHHLPEEGLRGAALAWSMGCASLTALMAEWAQVRQRVHARFEQIFAAAEEEDDAQADSFHLLWRKPDASAEQYLQLVAELGFTDGEDAAKRLHALRSGAYYRGLPENARRQLEQLLPRLLDDCLGHDNAGDSLLRCLQVLEAIGGRTTYLTLLNENASVLSTLTRLCAASPWIARMLSQQPILLDELLDPRNLEHPPSREACETELNGMLTAAAGDTELEMEALRRLRQTAMLRVASSDVMGHVRLMVVSDHLSALAEVCIAAALRIAEQHIGERFGTAIRSDGEPAHFAVIAFGKLGGIELGYGSDLDLVFLHDGAGGSSNGEREVDNQTWFTRLGQRLIHLISQPTAAGYAYEVDMRLRPSGASGLLVSDFSLYQNYQHSKAWLWEHQALVRARCVAGSDALGARFTELRRELLCKPRDTAAVASEVLSMREKMRQSLEKKESGLFDLKQGVGGVTDIEFLVQCLLLSRAAEFPQLIEFTDNIRQLEALGAVGLLPEAEQVMEIYRAYRRRRHALDLQEKPVLVPDQEFQSERELIASLWSTHVEQYASP